MSRKDECLLAFREGDTPKVMREIMEDFAQDLEAEYQHHGSVEGFRSRAKEMVAERILEIDKIRNEVVNDIIKSKRNRKVIQAGIDERVAAGQSRINATIESFKALISDTTDVTTGGKISFDNRQQVYASTLLHEFKKIERIEGGREFFESPSNELNITRELFELESGRSGGVTGDKMALDVAKVMQGFNNRELAIKQNAGISVGRSAAYVSNLKYSADMINKTFSPDQGVGVARQQFVDFMMKHIDVEKSFGTRNSTRESLKGMYDALVRGDDLRYKENFPDDLKETFDPRIMMSKRLSNKFNKSRKIVFKDGESMHAVRKALSEESLAESFYNRMHSSSKAAAAIATFGTNPELSYKNLRKWLTDKEPGLDEALRNQFSRVDDMFEMIKGQRPADTAFNKVANGYISFTVGKRLGSAVFSAGSDFPVAIGAVMSKTGKTFSSTLAELVDEFATVGLGSKETRLEYAEALNLLIENEMGSFHARHMDAAGGNPGKMGKFADWALTWTGFHRQILAARHSVAAVMARHVAMSLDNGKLTPNLEMNLRGYGFNQTNVKLLKAGLEMVGVGADPKRMVTPRALRKNLEQLDISGFKEADGFVGTDAAYRQDVADRYTAFLNDAAQIGSPNPSLRDRAALRMGFKADHPVLKALQVLTLFKSFAASFPRKLAHIIKGNPGTINKPFKEAIQTGTGLKYAGGLMVGLTGMAVLNKAARDLMMGKSPDFEAMNEDPTLAMKYVGEAALTTGVLGLWQSLGASMIERGAFQGAAEFALGPAGGDVKDIARLFSKVGSELKDAATEEQEWNTAASKSFGRLIEFGSKQVPNVWWGKKATQFIMIDGAQNFFDSETVEGKKETLQGYDEESGRRSIFSRE